MLPMTLGNGQKVFVDNQGNFFDGNGNPVSAQSIASAKKEAPTNKPPHPETHVTDTAATNFIPSSLTGKIQNEYVSSSGTVENLDDIGAK